jgi:hypothetical protein
MDIIRSALRALYVNQLDRSKITDPPKSLSSYSPLASLRQATTIAYQADRLHLLGMADFLFYFIINSKWDLLNSTVMVYSSDCEFKTYFQEMICSKFTTFMAFMFCRPETINFDLNPLQSLPVNPFQFIRVPHDTQRKMMCVLTIKHRLTHACVCPMF